MRKIVLALVLAAAAAFSAACGLVEGPLLGYGTRGTVTFVSVEGGFFGIVTTSGEKLDPINLPDAFRKDGLKVRFGFKPRPDLGSFHMWGTIVEIERIERE